MGLVVDAIVALGILSDSVCNYMLIPMLVLGRIIETDSY
jgi:hypothetical protein